jgi:hypothetical protein
MLACLVHPGCRPWTGPSVNTGGNFKARTEKLYYSSENATSRTFSRLRSRNQTLVTTDDPFYESDFHPLLFPDCQKKAVPASLPTMTTRSSSKQLQAALLAIQQVHGIMDLYELNPATMTLDIVVTALDGLIQKLFRDQSHLQLGSSVLEQLVSLAERSGELRIPLGSIMSLKIILTMQKQVLESQPGNSRVQYVEKAARLLLQYCQGSGTRRRSFLWPNEDLRSIFRFARDHSVGMTAKLWELLECVLQNHPDEMHTKVFQSVCFEVLAASEAGWSKRQYTLLLDLERRYQATNNTAFLVGDHELRLALSNAAKSGDAQQATWLFRKIYPRIVTVDRKKQLWCALMEAYAHSNETGSVEYMEQLVTSQEEAQHRDVYNIVLKARAKQGTPGSGLRAEEFLIQQERMSFEGRTKKRASFQPDMEIVFHVASAYLHESPCTYQNVADAESVVRGLLSTYNVSLYSSSHTRGEKQWPIFQCLLNAYTCLAAVDRRAVAASVDLCRFFLMLYQDGKICERPGAQHLRSVLVSLNHQPTQHNAEASVQLVRLFDNLERSSVTSENIELLLDTLAKHRDHGYTDDVEDELIKDSFRKNQ